MNILITLPKKLIEDIISKRKGFEMRSVIPKHFNTTRDGFFVVEKGTNKIHCWCRVSRFVEINVQDENIRHLACSLCVSVKYVRNYALTHRHVYLWKIDKVIQFEHPLDRSAELLVEHNPQSYSYCPLSYGESF